MDVLAALLDGPRARGAFLLRSVFEPPWAVRIADDAPLTLMVVLRGHMWVCPDDGPALRLGDGDVCIACGPGHYTVADDPTTRPAVQILPGGRCAPVGPVASGDATPGDLGTRTWGTGLDGSTMLLTGTYLLESEVSRRLLDALPPLLALPGAALDQPLVGLLAAEMAKDEPGQGAVLDRLFDLVLIAVLRAWFARSDAHTPAWYSAHHDPLAGAALRLMHDDPARAWTVGSLAATVGVSRAALARRFTETVGEPPMAYLAAWRLTLAADLLREPDATVAAVARRVGYATPYALSTAFKRVRGISPREHRRSGAAAS